MDQKTGIFTHCNTFFVMLNAAQRKKELLPFATAWMELESIMLSEISQAVKDKYHMISPISGTINQTNKQQNITRDIEIKNKLTVSRGEGEGEGRQQEGKVLSRNIYKGPIDKSKRGRMEGEVGENSGEKVEKTVFKQQLKMIKNIYVWGE